MDSFECLVFLRQAPCGASFSFAFFPSAPGRRVSTTFLCRLISHQTHTLLRLRHGFSGPQPASTLEMFSYKRMSNTLYLCCSYINIIIIDIINNTPLSLCGGGTNWVKNTVCPTTARGKARWHRAGLPLTESLCVTRHNLCLWSEWVRGRNVSSSTRPLA